MANIKLTGSIQDDFYFMDGYSDFSEPIITPKMVSSFIENSTDDTIIFDLDTVGGSVNAGAYIYGLFRATDKKIIINVMGMSASAGSYMMLGADEIYINPLAQVMVHNPWNYVAGNAEELRKNADDLDKVSEQMLDVYVKHTKLSRSKLTELLANETWLTAKEAVKYGFANDLMFNSDVDDKEKIIDMSTIQAKNSERIRTAVASIQDRSTKKGGQKMSIIDEVYNKFIKNSKKNPLEDKKVAAAITEDIEDLDNLEETKQKTDTNSENITDKDKKPEKDKGETPSNSNESKDTVNEKEALEAEIAALKAENESLKSQNVEKDKELEEKKETISKAETVLDRFTHLDRMGEPKNNVNDKNTQNNVPAGVFNKKG